ncbi:MAG: hypothetical protein ACKVQU_24020 [Burkholderiales bacterium]
MAYDKYRFRIRTKAGTLIDQVTIGAHGRTDAENRLIKMYIDCQILECHAQGAPEGQPASARAALPSYEQLLGKLYG